MGGGVAAERHPQRDRQGHGGAGEFQRVGQHLQYHLAHRPAADHVGAKVATQQVGEKRGEADGQRAVEPHRPGELRHRLGRGARAEQHLGGIAGNHQGEREQQDRGAEQHQHGGGQPRRQEVAHQARAKRSSDMSSPFGSTAGRSQSR